MKPYQKTILLILILLLEIGFIVWMRWQYQHNFLDLLQ